MPLTDVTALCQEHLTQHLVLLWFPRRLIFVGTAYYMLLSPTDPVGSLSPKRVSACQPFLTHSYTKPTSNHNCRNLRDWWRNQSSNNLYIFPATLYNVSSSCRIECSNSRLFSAAGYDVILLPPVTFQARSQCWDSEPRSFVVSRRLCVQFVFVCNNRERLNGFSWNLILEMFTKLYYIIYIYSYK
jgi:hypothetical protein